MAEPPSAHVEAASRLAREVQPDLYYMPELWWVAAQVHAAMGLRDRRRAAVQTGVDWITRLAREQVPDPFRESFLQRNPVNAQLLHWAAEA